MNSKGLSVIVLVLIGIAVAVGTGLITSIIVNNGEEVSEKAVTTQIKSEPGTYSLADSAAPLESTSLDDIELKLNSNIQDASITITPKFSLPEGVKETPGKSYLFLDVDASQLEGQLDNVKVKFKVRNGWIEENDAKKIYLLRYHEDNWQIFPASQIGKTDTHTHFEAVIPGFSLIAIVSDVFGLVDVCTDNVGVGLKISTLTTQQEGTELKGSSGEMISGGISLLENTCSNLDAEIRSFDCNVGVSVGSCNTGSLGECEIDFKGLDLKTDYYACIDLNSDGFYSGNEISGARTWIPGEERLDICSDTDNGDVSLVKGTLTATFKDGYQKIATDSCSGDVLTEWVCGGTTDPKGLVQSVTHKCEFGCQDGACISEEPIDEEELTAALKGSVSPSDATTADEVVIRGTYTSDFDKIDIRVDNTIVKSCGTSPCTQTYKANSLTTGTHKYEITVISNDEVIDLVEGSFDIARNIIAGELSVTHSPTSPKTTEAFTIDATYGGTVDQIKISVNSVEKKACDTSPCEFVYSANTLTEGTYNYKVTALVGSAITDTVENSFRVIKDSSLSASHSPENPTTKDDLTITSTYGGTFDQIKIFVDDIEKKICETSPCELTYSAGTLSAGDYVYEVNAILDNTVIKTVEDTITLISDTTPPTLSFVSTPGPSTSDTTPSFEWKCTDDSLPCQFQWRLDEINLKWARFEEINPSDHGVSSFSIYGNNMLVGGAVANIAYILEYDGSSWNREHTLHGASVGESSSTFGKAVDIFDDKLVITRGKTAAAGKTYFYEYDGSSWNFVQSLTGSSGDSGNSVSIYNNTAVVGSYENGRAHIYEYDGSSWNFVQTLNGDSGGYTFGWDVGTNKEYIFVSGYSAGAGIYVYEYDGSSWNEVQVLETGSIDSMDVYENVLVGSTNTQIHVYNNDGTSWNEVQIITPSNIESGDRFGFDIAVYDEIIIVGAPWYDDSCTDGGIYCGAVYVYEYDGSSWNEVQVLTLEDSVDSDNFGDKLALKNNEIFVSGGGFGRYILSEETTQGTWSTYSESKTHTTSTLDLSNYKFLIKGKDAAGNIQTTPITHEFTIA